MESMNTRLLTLGLVCFLAFGCGPKRPPEPPKRLRAARPAPPPPPRVREPGPLGRQATFVYDGVPLPEILSSVERQTGVPISVAPSIPLKEWGELRVTLRMADVTLMAFLDWLARPLRAEYAIEAQGGIWLTRSDDLLVSEPMEVRSYRVATHVQTPVPLRGVLSFPREQTLVLATLHDCLRYLEDRRPECHLAFHGEEDILVARLSARGHERLAEVLEAMRNGTPPLDPPRPSAEDLRARLRAPIECDGPAGPLPRVLAQAAERAGVNLGWDARALDAGGAPPTVAIPPGTRPLEEVLDLVFRQTRLRRFQLEPGHGIWLHLEGQGADFPASRATPWDRAVVRAYGVGALLEERTAMWILDEVRRMVDPGQRDRGLAAVSLFEPTARLIVVHDEEGQRRYAAAVQALLQSVGAPAREPGKKGRGMPRQ